MLQLATKIRDQPSILQSKEKDSNTKTKASANRKKKIDNKTE